MSREPLVVFFQWQVTPEEAGLAVGHLVRRRLRPSGTLYRRLKACGGLLLNGCSVPATAPVAAADRVAVALPATPSAAPQPVPVTVVYEDEHLLVVDKAAGLVMHPSRGHRGGTLVNGLVHYRLSRGEAPWVHPVHRLDRGVSGLVVIAKNPYVHERLVGAGRMRRSYAALLEGHLLATSGVVEVPIEEQPEAVRRSASPAGRPAYTRFRVVRRGQRGGRPATLVVLLIKSGRTHQIRLHMAHLGHPVWGDPVYGPGAPAGPSAPPHPGLEESRLALHARKVSLLHPVTGRRLLLRSPLPFAGPR